MLMWAGVLWMIVTVYFWPVRLIDWLGRDRVRTWIAESGIPPVAGFIVTVVAWLASMLFMIYFPFFLWRRSGSPNPAKKPTRAQLFFASQWPYRIWFTAIPLALAAAVAHFCAGFLHPFSAVWDFVQFAWFVLLGLLLGFFLALFPGWFIVGPLCYDREIKNGGPFKVGDTVQILSGSHKGRISRVYSTWQGDTLRVELSAKEKEQFKDIFSPTQLLREDST